MSAVKYLAGLPLRLLRRSSDNLGYLLRFSIPKSIQRIRDVALENQASIRDLKKRHSDTTDTLKNVHQECRQLRQECSQLRQECSQLRQECSQLRQECSQLGQKCSELQQYHKASMKVLENSLKGHTKSLQELHPLTKQVSRETLCILNTLYGCDPWLEAAKDIHKGERCFLLGCGPSLNKVDLSRLKGERVMGVNGTYLIDELSLDYFISVSRVFWKDHVAGLQEELRCKRCFFPPYIDVTPSCPVTWLRIIEEMDYQRVGEKPWMFSREAHRFICLGGTVIGVALQILYHMGFSEVILLGVDHDYGLTPEEKEQKGFIKTGQTLSAHFIKDYYQPDSKVFIDMEGAERAYRLAYEAFTRDDRRILNASPGTKLDTFPVVDFNSLF